jgi:hypothetical protein
LNFIKHENFPIVYANIIRYSEFQLTGECTLKLPSELYGTEVRPEEWLACVSKQAKSHRQTILSMDDGIKGNAISMDSMRQTGCSFVFFVKAWTRAGIHEFAWKAVRYWPEIVRIATTAHDSGRQCRIDVSIQGKTHLINL